MPRARDNAPAISKPTNRHITESDFVAGEAKPLKIPDEVFGPRRKRVREILKQNPFLEQCHVPAVVRLASLEEKLRKVTVDVEIEGLIIKNRFGENMENPTAKTMLSLQTSIVRQEHALAISVPARKEKIGAVEKKMKRGGPKPGNKKNQDGSVTPILKLA